MYFLYLLIIVEGVGQYPDSVYHMHVGQEELHPQIIKQVVYPWHFGTDLDPRICTSDQTDPASEPTIFVSDLQDGNKKLFFYSKFFACYLHFEAKLTLFFKDEKSLSKKK